ncbi:MAG TPA: hypothetical protein VN420_04330 [Candidatus Fimivivens sp.]|nr:hypothetical protein [Candidatus Fimivivens sp.]
MIQTKSVRTYPSPDDGMRVLILGFEGVLGVDVFSNLILPTLVYEEEAASLRPSRLRLDLYSKGTIGWRSFEELYRAEICRSDRAYREIERYAALSQEMPVTFLDMCETPECSLRRIIAQMCGCVISKVSLLIE